MQDLSAAKLSRSVCSIGRSRAPCVRRSTHTLTGKMECVFNIATEFTDIEKQTQSVFDADAFEAEWLPVLPTNAQSLPTSETHTSFVSKEGDEEAWTNPSSEIWSRHMEKDRRVENKNLRRICSLDGPPHLLGLKQAHRHSLSGSLLADNQDQANKKVIRPTDTQPEICGSLEEQCNLGLYDWCLKAALILDNVPTERRRRIKKCVLRLRRLRHTYAIKIKRMQALAPPTPSQHWYHGNPSATTSRSYDTSRFSDQASQSVDPLYSALYYIVCLESIRCAAERLAVSKILPKICRRTVLNPRCSCRGIICYCECAKAFALVKVKAVEPLTIQRWHESRNVIRSLLPRDSYLSSTGTAGDGKHRGRFR